MEDCIFCKLANGVFPTKSIYEDEEFKVILDLSPATKGHVLIIPKEHASDIYDLPENIVHNIFPLAQKMVKKITNKLKCDGFNIVQNNGKAAGQTVYHFHMHLIPRYLDDNQTISWNPQNVMEEELDELTILLNNEE